MNHNRLIAITGGIGSGKSVVSHLLEVLGYRVYNCDSRAKALMEEDSEIVRSLTERFGPHIYEKGKLCRQALAERVFHDTDAREFVNSVVHKAVKEDMLRCSNEPAKGDVLFVETAIPFVSGIDKMSYQLWQVQAPQEVRIKRAMSRSQLSYDDVVGRIEAQRDECRITEHTVLINNDNVQAIIPQVIHALSSI
mgnify:FL=1